MAKPQPKTPTYLYVSIGLLSLFVVVIAVISWKLALVMTPFIVYYTNKRKPWLGEPKSTSVNRNYRLPLSRVRVPRMRIK